MSKVKDMIEGVVNDATESVEVSLPNVGDPNWTQYVMQQFDSSEIADGVPSTDALRRVTRKIFGEIIDSDSDYLGQTSFGSVIVKHTLRVAKHDSGEIVDVSAVVDVNPNKLVDPYRNHPVATACTSAEGKALRRLLGVKIYSKEEIATNEPTVMVDTDMDTTKITDQQLLAINVLGGRTNVDIVKLSRKMFSRKIMHGKELTNTEGQVIINELSAYTRKPPTEDETGYSVGWESKFGE